MDQGHEQTFLQRGHKQPRDTCKDAQHHSSSGTCASEPQRSATSHLSEGLKSATQETTGIGKDVVKQETSCTGGGYANWCRHWKTVWKFLRKLKIELPYDLVIALLGTDPKNTTNSKGYMRPCVYSNIIYNSRIIKTAQVCIN